MALNGLLDVELRMPDPATFLDFWTNHGMLCTGDGVLGTASRPVQIRLAEDDHRRLSRLHLSCDTEKDLQDISSRLAAIGVDSSLQDSTLCCVDPILHHEIVIDVGRPTPLRVTSSPEPNRPGESKRIGARVPAPESTGTPPRRLGHVVLGSPDIAATTRFYIDALGYRISDQIANGMATFCRVETDHHNLLIHRAPVGHLNHYAIEMDDVDAIGRTGTRMMSRTDVTSVAGIGRHYLGSNVFWYLRDPAGNMFELFCDMDQIIDDDEWATTTGRRDWGTDGTPPPFSVWGPAEPVEFFRQPDLKQIAAARELRGWR